MLASDLVLSYLATNIYLPTQPVQAPAAHLVTLIKVTLASPCPGHSSCHGPGTGPTLPTCLHSAPHRLVLVTLNTRPPEGAPLMQKVSEMTPWLPP